MAVQRTLAIIKPDAVKKGRVGRIVTLIEEGGFRVLGMKLLALSEAQARRFYKVHERRAFYESLCKFMSSGPVVVMALEREDAINKWREMMGATNPKEAETGTIRSIFGTDVEKNAVHGSDSRETAEKEISFFFSDYELMGMSGE